MMGHSPFSARGVSTSPPAPFYRVLTELGKERNYKINPLTLKGLFSQKFVSLYSQIPLYLWDLFNAIIQP